MIDVAKLCLDKRKPDCHLMKNMTLYHTSLTQFTSDQGFNDLEEEPTSTQPCFQSGSFAYPTPPNHFLYPRPLSSSPCFNATSDSDTQSTHSESDCRWKRSSPRKILYSRGNPHENLSDPCSRSFGVVPHLLPAIGVFWDIENCSVPKGRSALQVVQVIRNTFLEGYREEEFIVVCDVTKETSQIVRELSDAQVNLIHVPSLCKNAADEKLRQSIRRYADRHSSPAAVVLITSDINFSAEVCDLRHRRKIHVILLHNNSTSEALLGSANETYNIGILMENLPHREFKEPKHLPVAVLVHNLPENKDKKGIKMRLKQLSSNCGGCVTVVRDGSAVIQFTSIEIAVRAQKRMEGENVYGNRITVDPPMKLSSIKAFSASKGRGTYSRSQEDHQFTVTNSGACPPQVSVYRTSAHSFFTQYNSNPSLNSGTGSLPKSTTMDVCPSPAGTNGTSNSAFEHPAQASPLITHPGNKTESNGWHSSIADPTTFGRPIFKTSFTSTSSFKGDKSFGMNIASGLQTIAKEPANHNPSISFSSTKNAQSNNFFTQNSGRALTASIGYAQNSTTNQNGTTENAVSRTSINQRPGSGPLAGRMVAGSTVVHRPHSNTPPSTPRMAFSNSTQGVKAGAKIPVITRQPVPIKNLSPYLFGGDSSGGPQMNLPSHVASSGESQERFFHPISAVGGTSKSDVIELQVTNLDQKIDAREMKKLITAAFAEHVTVLHVSMHTQSDGNLAAYIKLPSLEEAQFAVSQLHRRKIGYKRVMIAYVGTSGPSPQLVRSQIVSLLTEIPSHTLPLFKFCELFESRYLTSVSVSEMYKMKDVCLITEGLTCRVVSLNPDHRNTPSPAITNSTSESSMELPYCKLHRPGPDKGWAEQEMRPLPCIRVGLKMLTYRINMLIESHGGSLPLPSLPCCYEAQFHFLEVDETGVPLEHLVSCLPGVEIYQGVGCVKYLRWRNQTKGVEETVKCVSPMLVSQQALFSRELVDLLRTSPRCQLVFNRFIPAYHHHFGRQCRVADYGFTKLIDLLDSLPHVVQVLGEGNKRVITLSHRAQVRRFTSDLLRVLKSQVSKQIVVSQFPIVYQRALGRSWDVTDYGVCEVGDLLSEMSESSVLVTTENDEIVISIPKREQTADELQRTKIFADEVFELLRHAPQYSMLFNKFIPAYHHHFGHQCRVSDFGFTKLVELFEAIPHVVKVIDSYEGERSVALTLPESLRVLSHQMSTLVVASIKGRIPLANVSTLFTRHFGFVLKPETFGCRDISQIVQMLRTVMIVDSPGGSSVQLADQVVAEDPRTESSGQNRNHVCSGNTSNQVILEGGDGGRENVLEKYGLYMQDFYRSNGSLVYEAGPPKPDSPSKIIPVAWAPPSTSWQSTSPPLYSPFQPSKLQNYMGLPITLPPCQPHPQPSSSPSLTSPTSSLLDAHQHPSNLGLRLPHIVAPDPCQLPQPHSFIGSAAHKQNGRVKCEQYGSALLSNGETASGSSTGDETSSSFRSGIFGSDSADYTLTTDSMEIDSSGSSTPSSGKRKKRLAAQFNTPIQK